MTAQAADIYRYRDTNYDCLCLSNGRLFYAREHGFQPEPVDTGCWDGYRCEFEITDVVKLQALYIHDEFGNYPPLNGVRVTPREGVDRLLSNVTLDKYENLNMIVDYTGKILLAADFIWEYYIHKGLQRPYAYQTLLSAEFVGGVLKEMRDQSAIAEKLRTLKTVDRLAGR